MTDHDPPVEQAIANAASVADIAEPSITMDRLTKVYIKIRDARSKLTKDYETEDERLKTQQAEVASLMKDQMRALGVKSVGTTFGTVSARVKTRYYAQDWDAMYRFIHENDAAFLLEKRIAQTNMSEFLNQNPGNVPPGLNTMSETEISVSKPRK